MSDKLLKFYICFIKKVENLYKEMTIINSKAILNKNYHFI